MEVGCLGWGEDGRGGRCVLYIGADELWRAQNKRSMPIIFADSR